MKLDGMKLSEVRKIYRSARFAWAHGAGSEPRDLARTRLLLELATRREKRFKQQRDEAISLAKQATNAMACIARSQYQHREVDRLHQAIADLAADRYPVKVSA
jgi:hypothetical protein